MNEVICPHCRKAFKIDEAGYADILKQVKDTEFERQLHERLELAAQEKATAIELATAMLRGELQKEAANKDTEIQTLQERLKANELAQKLAVTEAIGPKDNAIQQLEAKVASIEAEKKLAIAAAISAIEKERDEFKSSVKREKLEKELLEKSLKDKYETQIRDRNETIERLRDMKARLSTKMVGETLEQHCDTEFNRIRATAFPRAYFEKDNDARSGSKGDFIFRDYDDGGIEFVSIMFDMKNESDTSSTKSKNEDFLSKLDKDRNDKGCEYAVLVSLLEPENELYNTGIVDVFHRYPKMYVVRPQFFIPMITLLRNVCRQNIWRRSRRRLAERGPRPGVDIKRRACGAASVGVRWSSV